MKRNNLDTHNNVYQELTSRYNRVSVSTIKDVLKGKLRVPIKTVDFKEDKHLTPKLEEAEDAFKSFDCAIFTAFRSGYTLEQNLQRNALLKADMEDVGYLYRPVVGCYREADQEYADIEYCFFAYNRDIRNSKKFFEQAYALSEKYEQDCFLYKRAGINRIAFYVATNERCREEYRGNIKFAGQLYINVPDVGGWTDCSDGRFSFQLKGMILVGTGNKNIKIGEGDLFDIDGYSPDGLLVIRGKEQMDLKEACHNYQGDIPLVERYFDKEELAAEDIHLKVLRGLSVLKKQKCKRIGFHCSASLNGSYVLGAVVAFNTIKMWAERNSKKMDWIVIVDIYGDYSKALNNLRQ